jgi:hypothetical protein
MYLKEIHLLFWEVDFFFLYALLDVCDERPQTELFGLEIHLMERIEQRVDTLIVDDSDYRRTHARPCVGAVVRLTSAAAASLHALQIAEATAVEAVEQGDDALVVCLVECYQNRFHI